MKFGFIGAGGGAQTYAKHFVRHGNEVVLSNTTTNIKRRKQ
jgi:3-hydroxyisobutyrate dehydrogenase-like beta-hydroxyacid dehydrogenase